MGKYNERDTSRAVMHILPSMKKLSLDDNRHFPSVPTVARATQLTTDYKAMECSISVQQFAIQRKVRGFHENSTF